MMRSISSGDQRRQPALHRAHSLIEIERAQHGFKRIGQQGLPRAPAAHCFAFAHADMLAQANLIGEFAQFLGAHKRGANGRQAAFIVIGILAIQPARHDEVQNRIAQKFQPFIVERLHFGMLVQIRAMREGVGQEPGILERR